MLYFSRRADFTRLSNGWLSRYNGSFGMEQKTSFGLGGVSQTTTPTAKIGALDLMKKK